MQKPQGYDESVAYSGEFKALPPGAYVCLIRQAKEEIAKYSGNTMISLALDILEGDFKGFYSEIFTSKSDTEKAKWPCVFRQAVDGKSLPFFKGLITSIEESNPGFVFDFDEKKLKGKKLGIIFRSEEYYSNSGEIKEITKPFLACSIKTILENNYKIPSTKKVESSEAPVCEYMPPEGFSNVPFSSDDDLPF
jgi:hypothetical protein